MFGRRGRGRALLKNLFYARFAEGKGMSLAVRMCKSRSLLNRGGISILLDGLIGPFFVGVRK